MKTNKATVIITAWGQWKRARWGMSWWLSKALYYVPMLPHPLIYYSLMAAYKAGYKKYIFLIDKEETIAEINRIFAGIDIEKDFIDTSNLRNFIVRINKVIENKWLQSFKNGILYLNGHSPTSAQFIKKLAEETSQSDCDIVSTIYSSTTEANPQRVIWKWSWDLLHINKIYYSGDQMQWLGDFSWPPYLISHEGIKEFNKICVDAKPWRSGEIISNYLSLWWKMSWMQANLPNEWHYTNELYSWEKMISKNDLISEQFDYEKEALLIKEIFKKFPVEYLSEKIKILSNESNIVTNIDRKLDSYIINEIQNNFPDDNILSEECGFINKHSLRTWIIDPLDGTKRFIKGAKDISVNIWLVKSWDPVVWWVFFPLQQTLYYGYYWKNGWVFQQDLDWKKTLYIDKKDSLRGTWFVSCDGFNKTLWKKVLEDLWIQETDNQHSQTNRILSIILKKSDVYLFAWERLYIWDICAIDALFRILGWHVTNSDWKNFIYEPFSSIHKWNILFSTFDRWLHSLVLWYLEDHLIKSE